MVKKHGDVFSFIGAKFSLLKNCYTGFFLLAIGYEALNLLTHYHSF